MIDNKSIYEGTVVLKEFKGKLAALCREYYDKVQEVCPEDIVSKNFNSVCERETSSLARLQFYGNKGIITRKELEDAGFVLRSSYKDMSYYDKTVNGINVGCSVDTEEGDTE